MYKYFLRPILFLLDAEKAHYFTSGFLKLLLRLPFAKKITGKCFQLDHPSLERNVFGLKFKNPVGLAAGFDKNAAYIDEFACLGFGFIEVGTVTPRPQSGNEKPRLFRLKKDGALINRMGFNNEGVEKMIGKLRKRKTHLLIGGNIGKNKTTPNENALEDYLFCFEKLFDFVDYFVVNVSSPNTPGLRELQEKEPLLHLLQTLQASNRQKPATKPILLKIAPDLSNEQLDEILEVVELSQIAGIIATNTTIERKNLFTWEGKLQKIGNGGLSGKPLKDRSTEVIRYLHQRSGGKIPIIGVGGVHSPEDAIEKLKAGASLLQLYTGFVYEGPWLIKKINRALLQSPVSKVN